MSSTGREKSLPNVAEFTLEGVRIVSAELAPVRKLLLWNVSTSCAKRVKAEKTTRPRRRRMIRAYKDDMKRSPKTQIVHSLRWGRNVRGMSLPGRPLKAIPSKVAMSGHLQPAGAKAVSTF